MKELDFHKVYFLSFYTNSAKLLRYNFPRLGVGYVYFFFLYSLPTGKHTKIVVLSFFLLVFSLAILFNTLLSEKWEILIHVLKVLIHGNCKFPRYN